MYIIQALLEMGVIFLIVGMIFIIGTCSPSCMSPDDTWNEGDMEEWDD